MQARVGRGRVELIGLCLIHSVFATSKPPFIEIFRAQSEKLTFLLVSISYALFIWKEQEKSKMSDPQRKQETLSFADAQFIVFTDFDGTVTQRDSNDCATDELGFGLEKRRELNIDILNGTKTFRDAFKEMLDSVCQAGHSFDQVVEYLRKEIKLDPGFKVFFDYCKSEKIPVVIVSSGMVPIIRAILTNLLGPSDASQIPIIANDVELLSEDGKRWTIKYKHPESGFGHDKSRATAPYRDLEHKPTLFFCGDGVSDLSAARAADLLFVKVIKDHTNDLQVHCDREQIPYVPFSQFEQVKDVVKSVVDKEMTVQQHLDAKK